MTDRKVALVTGSGKKRVGFHVAAALAARGYALVIHYRTSAADAQETAEQFARAHGVPVHTIGADLANEAEVKALVAGTLERFGRIDALVNCAAIWERKRLEDVTAADVRQHFEINTLGTFLTCQHAGLAMVGQPAGGCIVNFGDWADARPYPGYAAYFPSKAAIPGLTRDFAVELGTRNPNVRVNAVLPGPVMLPAEMTAAEREEVAAATLVKREGTPEHVVRAVLHLIDNDFVTGACLPVDGGRTVFAGGS
ncbi:short-chain dehydrogenase reductase sdr : Short-chain dehydrogenase/reductase SDR OS=Pirellula staleyi (strain ATCC 27377 / DSM 6068 / ICPB 4128) GN=Psta_1052 PE=4 SV=1: adh_short_C2 [Gemmataceae bacterium]|nr:short-chain dehydrogenase reductase sdr : Short-chain dehydrogenase/reductase SDR OS=Pirellula staleyi (strain ATCC 27377 / DSM 6068 / ICPB 4128) GN=Psta_1052 PE=4 SV=1: adh_short_C2 [Gemmataceae bacterium]VTT97420.1 short-chain dehydrogenase reductase sdr : Short-chain dehydrogenase/reductase SDR OS=Pirellula staleyi (strain ATCC 27377 / DSM 6068 / ICPB 4128) GN=Psta_1052 PE=4 SV=1: adh_short_C2 [Gemmataceae bacterium]